MVYLLGILLAAACGLLSVLFYLDIAPSGALYKIWLRFGEPPERLRPHRQDAPYRQAGAAGSAAHHPVLLNLPTSDGSGQAAHPDVLYIPEGFGAKGWTYWMVCTPYPYGNAGFENPEIFVSYDGIVWSKPDGGENPLVPSPKIAGDHHSDPDMLFWDNQIWLYYRETVRGKRPKHEPNENKIYLMKSPDGVHWSVPVQALSERTGRQLLSPAVVHDGRGFAMWSVEVHGEELKLMRRRSPDGAVWSSAEPCNVIGMDAGRHLWHIDVTREKDRLSAALVSYLGLGSSGGQGSRLHYAYSEDEGLTWLTGGFLLEQAYEFESQLQYRGSLLQLPERPDEYRLWYSAASVANVFSIAYVALARAGDRLLPCEVGTGQAQDKTLTTA